MKRSIFLLICSLFLTLSIYPTQAGAYSYGDPNTEEVAEEVKQIVAELNASPANFDKARTLFETIKPELDMHMGQKPAEAVLNDLASQNKEQAVLDLQRILVLNIARRMENVASDFQNFDQNRMLLAKANATYEALSPQVKEKDAALDDSIRNNFKQALESLGNPGLFGVGVKEPDPTLFQTNEKQILDALQAQFKLESVEVGHFPEGGTSDHAAKPSTATGSGEAGVTKYKNWIPIAVIIVFLAGILIYAKKRKR